MARTAPAVLTVGLTGKLGAGKSTVGRALAARGAVVIDADAVAREVLAPGTAAAAEVLAAFGPRVRAADGSVDRRALAREVFSSAPSRQRLEAITHPRIRAEIMRRREMATSPVVVIELPLLDRRRVLDYGLEAVVVVDVPTDVAVARAVGRGMDEQDVRARLHAQPSDEQRLAVADWTVDNSGPLAGVAANIDKLWAWLMERAARH